jgi:uncharacterized protein
MSSFDSSPLLPTPEEATSPPPPDVWRSFPDDLRTPWGWPDLLVFVLVIGASFFLVGAFLLGIFLLNGVSLQKLQDSTSLKTLFAVLNQLLLYVALLAYLYAFIRARTGGPFWRTLGWRPLEGFRLSRPLAYAGCIAGGSVFAFLIQLASVPFEKETKLPIEALFQDRRSAILLMLMSVLVAPQVEETVFRGYIYPVVARSFGISGGVLITGVLFGLLHAPQLWGGWMHILLMIVVGIVFTYIRATSRTVLASYLAHLSYNSFLFAIFLVSTGWLRNLPVHH